MIGFRNHFSFWQYFPGTFCTLQIICDKVFKNRPSKICGRQPLKNFTWSILEYFAPYVAFYHILRLQPLFQFIQILKTIEINNSGTNEIG